MDAPSVKEEARRLIESFSDDSTRGDLMRLIYVRRTIEAGLEDGEAERVADVAQARSKFGLPGTET